MAGHSKFKNIMHRKGAQDKKRAAAFSKLSREITVAAKSGLPDPAMNARLRAAVLAARAGGMPKDNIERSISKASASDAETYEEVRYEGFGPGGVSLIIEALTDNRNRTAAEVRHIFAKSDGSLGEAGAVAWLFERRGVVLVDGSVDEDELTLAAAEGGADDVSLDGSSFQVVGPPESLSAVRSAIEEAGIEVQSAELTMVPKTSVELEDENAAKKVLRLIDALEENDDVQSVSHNAEIPDSVMA